MAQELTMQCWESVRKAWEHDKGIHTLQLVAALHQIPARREGRDGLGQRKRQRSVETGRARRGCVLAPRQTGASSAPNGTSTSL